MENMGIENLVQELQKLNPGVKVRFTVEASPGTIITNHHFKFNQYQMILPEGYYLTGKNGITNRCFSATGNYEFFNFMTEREYRSMVK